MYTFPSLLDTAIDCMNLGLGASKVVLQLLHKVLPSSTFLLQEVLGHAKYHGILLF